VAAVSAFALGFFDKAVAVSEQGAAAAGGPVVLEMFTSPGCSSWPPADALLSDIGSTTKNVIPLAYHVDYWNHLGWSDPFSSPKFSRRQSSYARAMDLGGGYTPQAVIEGSSQCVGSDGRSIWRAVDAARSASNLDRVNLHASLAVARPRTLRIRVSAQLSSGSATGNRDVMVAIFENGGREITYDYTVRKLVPAFELDSAHDGSVERQFSVDLDPHGHSTTSGWQHSFRTRNHCGFPAPHLNILSASSERSMALFFGAFSALPRASFVPQKEQALIPGDCGLRLPVTFPYAPGTSTRIVYRSGKRPLDEINPVAEVAASDGCNPMDHQVDCIQ
jgi:hypothetical protein